jgi:LysM repeat protein
MIRFHARYALSIVLIVFNLLLAGCAREREAPAATSNTGSAATANLTPTATLEGSNPTTIAIQNTATPTVTSVPPGEVAPTNTPVPVLTSEDAAPAVTAVTSLPNPQGSTASTTSTSSDVSAGIATTTGQGESGIHIVQAGENLYRISLKYDVSLQELARLNNITNPNMIYVGQRLQVPGLTSGGDGSYYVVEPGDTLMSIAFQYNTSVSALVSANRLANSDFIYVGQRLAIP